MKTTSFISVFQLCRFWIKLSFIVGLFGVLNTNQVFANSDLSFKDSEFSILPDSIGVEIRDGKQVVIHKLMPKETYYGLSRKYNVELQDLITFNNNKPLKIGDLVYIPTQRVAAQPVVAQTSTNSTTQASAQSQVEEEEVPEYHLNPGEFTEYRVGKGETLFAVSRRFGVPVESIKIANGMRDDNLKENMVIRVPNKAIVPEIEASVREQNVAPITQVIDSVSLSNASAAEAEVKKNRYGVREVIEKGLGVWMDDLNPDGSNMLVLHKTAQIGTVVKITNPMTGHSTFAKVVGKFVDSAETQGAIIVLSKSVANVIGILDRRFQVEIAYGAPLDM